MAGPRALLIDTDPGVDDALALLMASALEEAGEIEVLGVVTVPGNVDSETGALNALRVFGSVGELEKWLGRVRAGASRPLARAYARYGRWVHGEDGLGDAGLPRPQVRPRHGGIELILDALRSSPRGGLEVLTLGPLTNLALALMVDPDAARGLKRVVSMAGCFGLTPHAVGNVTPVSEFNVFVDPEAAALVFEALGPKVEAVGLDVTQHPGVRMTAEDLRALEASGSRRGGIAAALAKGVVSKLGYFAPHDPVALAALLRPELFEFKELPVAVVTQEGLARGMTVLERRQWLRGLRGADEYAGYIEGPTIRVASGIDAAGVKELIASTLAGSRRG